MKILTASAVLLTCCALLTSCAKVRDFFRKKADITFVANGGAIAEKYLEDEKNTGDSKSITMRCFAGDTLPDDIAEKEYYTFTGWYTKKEGGKRIISCPGKDTTYYAQWESANLNRFVDITDIKVSTEASPAKKHNLVRISSDSSKNSVTVTLTSSYYIKSFGNDHVDEGEPVRFRIRLDGQYEHFDKPIEGSTVWYGGSEEAPDNRTAVILATDDKYVYARHESTNETEDGSIIYKWKKSDCMINLADVRTDIIYDIYNAYNSRFFPIRGKAMYMDNGGKGLKRYGEVSKDSAMHKNEKTGKTTFMVPVQWDFAEKVALAQSRARDAGVTLYIVDSFRPAASVDPVAKKVKDASLLAYGGTSAHNFGMAVDTGWQRVNEDGEPVGEPYDKNLQELDKKKAVKGPRGNSAEIWWQGIHKLPQEWWHYGDTNLDKEYRSHAKRVAELYVNQAECLSAKRSTLD